MVGGVLWDLDLGRDSVAAGNGGVAGVLRGIVNSNTSITIESLAGKPVIAVARLILATVRTVAALLPVNISAGQESFFKTVLSSLLLSFGGKVLRIQELVDYVLILADAIREHAAVVAVVVDTPLDFNNLAGRIGRNRLLAPICAGLIVVDTNACIVATWTCAPDLCLIEVWPSCHWLQDSTLRARIRASLRVMKLAHDVG